MTWVMRPGRGDITTTRSDRYTASGIEWVTNTTLVDVSAQIRSSSDCMCSRVISSRAPNGSSISSSAGWAARARAMATRCCIPPESCHGRCSAKSPSLTSCSISIARCRRLDLSQPFSSSGSSTFFTTLRQSNSPACWKAMPYSWSRRARSADLPLTVIVPELGSMRLAMRRSSVDLPQPDGPIRLTNSPAATVEVDLDERVDLARRARVEDLRRRVDHDRRLAHQPSSAGRGRLRIST